MTNRISLLPDHVANQIAAGEVIQRPASVVKELLENAVDANAQSIKLIIKDAGKTLIQVVDDGIGIESLDMKLAFERHATSKINLAEDLFKLKTKGFRGEALASIVAISHVEIHTRVEQDEVSHSLKIEGSKFKEETLSTKPKGTSIAVKSLFYNIPARRNFLKSNNVELRHVIDEFHRVALSHPDIEFLFFNNANKLFNLPKTKLRKRISSIFGSKLNSYLLPVDETTSLARLNGFVVKPDFAKKTRGQQFFFVNNRFIKSPFLHHSIIKAFEGLLKPGYHPGYFLYLNVDPKTIDVNIHPSKTEIKFEEEQSIYAILRSTVKHSLGIFQVLPSLDFEKNKSMDLPYSFKEKLPSLPNIEVDSNFNPFISSQNPTKTDYEDKELLFSKIKFKSLGTKDEDNNLLKLSQTTRVFQLFLKYIVCPLQSNMLIIDQNRAHQRILYEKFLTSITKKRGASQQLLFPLKIKLNPNQKLEYQETEEILKSSGFIMELKKNKYLEILGCPESCPFEKIEEIIETLLSGVKNIENGEHFSQADQIAKIMAKGLAVKSGKQLELIEQQALVDDFFGCKETSVSPFNKPIFFTLDKLEIEQKLN